MKQNHRHIRNTRRRLRHARFRPIRRRGRFLGLIGLAALGYTLLEKNREKKAQLHSDAFVDWEGDIE